MRTAIRVAVCVGLIFGCACDQAKRASMPGGGSAGRDFVESAGAALEAPLPAAAAAADKPESVEQIVVPGPSQRKLIRNARVSIDADSVETALVAIRSSVQSLGGYISDESQTQDAIRGPVASVTCRVPADKLDAILSRVKSLGRLGRIDITAQDITEQYFDLQLRMRNQRQLEETLLGLLKRPNNKLSDLLDVERELARVRGELDQLEGKQRFWDNQVAFSTVTVSVRGPRAALAADEGGIWSALRSAIAQAGENFVSFIAGLIAAIGWLIPLALALAAGLWVLRALWRFMRRRRPATTSRATPPPTAG